MYSFHSDIDEKNKLLHVLLQHGIETTVDRVAKKARIKDWIQNSVIAEEDENEVSFNTWLPPFILLSRTKHLRDQLIIIWYFFTG